MFANIFFIKHILFIITDQNQRKIKNKSYKQYKFLYFMKNKLNNYLIKCQIYLKTIKIKKKKKKTLKNPKLFYFISSLKKQNNIFPLKPTNLLKKKIKKKKKIYLYK